MLAHPPVDALEYPVYPHCNQNDYNQRSYTVYRISQIRLDLEMSGHDFIEPLDYCVHNFFFSIRLFQHLCK
jgi:hypothetical protein